MVNLLSDNQGNELRNRLKTRVWAGSLLALSVFSFILLLIILPFTFLVRSRIENFTLEKERIVAALEQIKVSPEDREVREYVYLLDRAEEVVAKRDYSVVIEDILSARPKSVRIFSMTLDSGLEVSVHGEVDDRGALVEFASALRRQPRIDDVDVPIANFAEGVDAPFSLTLTVNE